jgi:hypothetical protein
MRMNTNNISANEKRPSRYNRKATGSSNLIAQDFSVAQHLNRLLMSIPVPLLMPTDFSSSSKSPFVIVPAAHWPAAAATESAAKYTSLADQLRRRAGSEQSISTYPGIRWASPESFLKTLKCFQQGFSDDAPLQSHPIRRPSPSDRRLVSLANNIRSRPPMSTGTPTVDKPASPKRIRSKNSLIMWDQPPSTLYKRSKCPCNKLRRL